MKKSRIYELQPDMSEQLRSLGFTLQVPPSPLHPSQHQLQKNPFLRDVEVIWAQQTPKTLGIKLEHLLFLTDLKIMKYVEEQMSPQLVIEFTLYILYCHLVATLRNKTDIMGGNNFPLIILFRKISFYINKKNSRHIFHPFKNVICVTRYKHVWL